MNKIQGLRVAGTIAIFSLIPTLAWSYIDPGNGAYMVQVLFTLAGAVLFYIRHPIRFLQAVWNWLFRRKSSGVSPIDNPADLDAGSNEVVSESELSRRES